MGRLLVLGSNSFGGSVFINSALDDGYDVVGVSRSVEEDHPFLPYKLNPNASKYRFYQIHLVKNMHEIFEVISNFQPEYIIDFAGQGMVAESWLDPALWYQTNLVSKVLLYEHLRKQTSLSKYIRISTPEVYGSTDDLATESHPYNPSTPYAISHAAVDMNINAYFKNYGFPGIIVRFANFFGPGQQFYRITPRTILAGLTGQRLLLHGGGTSIRAFIDARDVASAILLTLKKAKAGDIYHFSTNHFISIRTAVESILSKINIDFDDVVDLAPDRLGKDYSYLMDSSKAFLELGWSPQYDFDQTILDTIAWIKGNISLIKTLSWEYEHKT